MDDLDMSESWASIRLFILSLHNTIKYKIHNIK